MEELSCREAKNILLFRTRMMKVKDNYKNNYNDLKCRWCGIRDETQKHIIEECEEFPVDRKSIKIKNIFEEDIKSLHPICKILQEVYNELEK